MQSGDSWTRSAALAAAFIALAAGMAAQGPGDLELMLTHVGDRVEQYYRRAQSLVCHETVTLVHLSANFSPEEFARVLEYELRVAWEADADGGEPQEATVTRQLLKINGRKPKPDAEPGCTDPRSIAPDPLNFLLPHNRAQYIFGWSRARGGDRGTVMVDYRSRETGTPEVSWRGDCVSFDLPGRTKGRIWIDSGTHDVMRMDEQLIGQFNYRLPREKVRFGDDWWVIERADTSVRYRPVVFHEPEETLVLPATIESFQVIRGAGIPRLRTTQRFSDYKRFLTGARIVK